MKNNIKNHLSLGAAIAGSVFLVSCDSRDEEGVSNSLGTLLAGPTPPVVAPTPTAGDSINSKIAFDNLATGNNSLVLTFDADPSLNVNIFNPLPIATFGDFATVGAKNILAGQTFIFSQPYAATGVTATPSLALIRIDLLSDGPGVPPSGSDITDLLLIETTFSPVGNTQQSDGTFRCNFVVAEVLGTAATSSPFSILSSLTTTITANGADAAGAFIQFPLNLDSAAGKQPEVAPNPIGTSISFKVAVGDILFSSNGQLYITDALTTGIITISSGTPKHNISTPRDAAPGEVFCLTQGGSPEVSLPQTGSYKMVID